MPTVACGSWRAPSSLRQARLDRAWKVSGERDGPVRQGVHVRSAASEYGRYLASLEPPITDEQAEAAARILASDVEEGETAPN